MILKEPISLRNRFSFEFFYRVFIESFTIGYGKTFSSFFNFPSRL